MIGEGESFSPSGRTKGNKEVCSNHRGITLLSIPGKLFAMILLERIRPTFHNHRHSEQAGFTAGRRSTTEHIFGTRRIIEKSKAFNKSTYIAFIDFKAAFDSVSRDSLGKIHQICGVPQELSVLVRQLYTDTRSAVRLASSLPDEFTIETGVTQGCVIVPDLFNCAIDQLMRRLLSRCSLGIQLVEYKFTDLDHADDIAIHSIREHTKQPTASSLLRQRRLRWFGHLHRMPSFLPVRRGYDFNPNFHGWKIPRGRPKTRWADSIKHDLNSAGLDTTNSAQMVFHRPQ